MKIKSETTKANRAGESSNLNRRTFLQVASAATIGMAAETTSARREITSKKMIRVGLIGRDGHWRILIGSIPKTRDVQWAAYAMGEPGEDSTWLRRQPAYGRQTRIYENYYEMLEKEALDVVGICLPFYENAVASIAAARRGINVISEKPAATTLDDLSRLEQTVRKSGVLYNIMLDMRGMPIFQAARKAVQQGAIGEPILVTGQKSYQWGPGLRPWYYKRRKTYGGTIAWVGIHALDYMRWVSGQDYAQVAAWEGNKAHPEYPGCEDHAGLLFRLANGGTATCHLDFLRPPTASSHGDSRLRIAGSEGILEASEVGNRASLISTKGKNGDLPLPPAEDLFSRFVGALRGEGQPLLSTEESFSITRVCLKSRDAADRGAWVTL